MLDNALQALLNSSKLIFSLYNLAALIRDSLLEVVRIPFSPRYSSTTPSLVSFSSTSKSVLVPSIYFSLRFFILSFTLSRLA